MSCGIKPRTSARAGRVQVHGPGRSGLQLYNAQTVPAARSWPRWSMLDSSRHESPLPWCRGRVLTCDAACSHIANLLQYALPPPTFLREAVGPSCGVNHTETPRERDASLGHLCALSRGEHSRRRVDHTTSVPWWMLMDWLPFSPCSPARRGEACTGKACACPAECGHRHCPASTSYWGGGQRHDEGAFR